MFCSTIVPTIGRSTLARAVQSVLEQDFTGADFEVIVVNDSGSDLPEEQWQASERVRVIQTNQRERSVARNTGAAIARGEYLHFLDDDDILLPGAMSAFWELAQRETEADWLYGSWRIVDNNGNIVNMFDPKLSGNIFALLISGEGLPLQGSLLRTRAFFNAGGFDPRLSACEDRDLFRRIALLGNIAYTTALVAQIRIGEAGSSTNWSLLSESDKLGREKALQAINAYHRVRASAKSSYWRGRSSRAYFASMVWNLKRRELFVAMSRCFAGLALTGLNVVSKDYWRGLRTKIGSKTG